MSIDVTDIKPYGIVYDGPDTYVLLEESRERDENTDRFWDIVEKHGFEGKYKGYSVKYLRPIKL